jgi:hypothetical protein
LAALPPGRKKLQAAEFEISFVTFLLPRVRNGSSGTSFFEKPKRDIFMDRYLLNDATEPFVRELQELKDHPVFVARNAAACL